MDDFRGAEPLVGQIAGLRTFRVDDTGLLLPLYSNEAWYDGTNTAACTPPTGDRRGFHSVPSEDCECGFYAYGTVEAAARNRQMRYVRAVVSCWGGVVAGTQGIRAEHARIDALWLHPQIPPWLRTRIAGRYPSARMYAEAGALVAEHPLTQLHCYDEPHSRRKSASVLTALAFAAVLSLGLLPYSTLSSTHGLWESWLTVTVGAAVLTAWLVVGAHGVGHLAAAAVVAGVLGWLLAPAFGLAGWLLRIPLLRAIAVGAGGYLFALTPRYFPVVRTPRERTFRGVRP